MIRQSLSPLKLGEVFHLFSMSAHSPYRPDMIVMFIIAVGPDCSHVKAKELFSFPDLKADAAEKLLRRSSMLAHDHSWHNDYMHEKSLQSQPIGMLQAVKSSS